MDLFIVILVSLLMVPIAIFTSDALRITFGLFLMVFFPGYVLIAALFPKKDSLRNVERLAFSFGTSIAILTFIGLLLNITWGIQLYPVLYALLIFIVVGAIVSWIRRRNFSPDERFTLQINIGIRGAAQKWGNSRTLDKVIGIVLLIAVLGTIGCIAYLVKNPTSQGKFTEFYTLGADGKLATYPDSVPIGKNLDLILGIIDKEGATTTYRIMVTLDGNDIQTIGPITLDDGQKWEENLNFTPDKAGENQKLEFLLLKGNDLNDYSTLHLWVNVIDYSRVSVNPDNQQ